MTISPRHPLSKFTGLAVVLLTGTTASAQCVLPDSQWLRSGTGEGRHGASTSIDGAFLALGAPSSVPETGRGTGLVHILQWTGGAWELDSTLRPRGGSFLDEFGSGVDLDGDHVLVGSPRSRDDLGRGDLFVRRAGQWEHLQRLLPSREAPFSWYGFRVALEGGDAFVAAPRQDARGAVFAFVDNGTRYVERQVLAPASLGVQDFFGHSVAVDGRLLAVGAPLHDDVLEDDGAVFVYRKAAGSWSLVQQLGGSGGENDQFGYSVAVQGSRIVVGAPYEDDIRQDRGAVHVFEDVGGTFALVQRLEGRDVRRHAHLGLSVAIDGDTILAGSPQPTRKGPSFVATFRRIAGSWIEVAELRQDSFDNPRSLGSAVAVRGRRAVAGAAPINQSFAFDVPTLLLAADDTELATADPVTFTHCSGEPGRCVILAALEFDGTPRFQRIAAGILDSSGDWQITLTTPPGLAGHTAKVASFSLIQGRVEASNPIELRFD